LNSYSGETTIVITYNPAAVGTDNDVLRIYSDDCDEATYNFNITAQAVSGLTFKPTCGPEMTIIKIFGSGFTGLGTHGGDYIKINGTAIPSSDYTVISNTEIEARVQIGTTTGKVEISNNSAVQLSASNYTVTENCQLVCP